MRHGDVITRCCPPGGVTQIFRSHWASGRIQERRIPSPVEHRKDKGKATHKALGPGGHFVPALRRPDRGRYAERWRDPTTGGCTERPRGGPHARTGRRFADQAVNCSARCSRNSGAVGIAGHRQPYDESTALLHEPAVTSERPCVRAPAADAHSHPPPRRPPRPRRYPGPAETSPGECACPRRSFLASRSLQLPYWVYPVLGFGFRVTTTAWGPDLSSSGQGAQHGDFDL